MPSNQPEGGLGREREHTGREEEGGEGEVGIILFGEAAVLLPVSLPCFTVGRVMKTDLHIQ